MMNKIYTEKPKKRKRLEKTRTKPGEDQKKERDQHHATNPVQTHSTVPPHPLP